MKTLLQINSGIIGSTGNIMLTLDKYAKNSGFKSYMASVNNKSSKHDYPENHLTIGTIIEKHIHRKIAYITGNDGGYSYFATRRFLKKVDKIKPDIIHLHNLHWNYINLELLFAYLKKHAEIKVVLTTHDCWSYTGHCPYYDMLGCELWKTNCHDCKAYNSYPATKNDNSEKMYKRKKKWFSELSNLMLVTPSKWINNEIKESFLKQFPSRIISNGIDTDTFQYTESRFREKYNLKDKFIIFGSAYSWNIRKGFDFFMQLTDAIDERYKIVLIGGFSVEQEKECERRNILHFPRTSSKKELAELYSTSNVFLNPTREEMFGLVNIEAQACGTPVITFDSGGSPECIGEGCGYIIPKNDLESTMKCLEELYNNQDKINRKKIREWALNFESSKTYENYINLYNELLDN